MAITSKFWNLGLCGYFEGLDDRVPLDGFWNFLHQRKAAEPLYKTAFVPTHHILMVKSYGTFCSPKTRNESFSSGNERDCILLFERQILIYWTPYFIQWMRVPNKFLFYARGVPKKYL